MLESCSHAGREASPATDASLACAHHRLVSYERPDPQRDEVEGFVRSVFEAKYAAHVCSFMPTMLAMRNDAGGLCGVAGYRRAADETLFLERYLNEPVETAISRATQQDVQRSQVVEVGNLAGVNCRAAVRLVTELPRLLLERGQRWIVFTATGAMRQLLTNYSAPLVELASAQAARVAGLGDDWGDYYATDPRVMVGYLPDGLRLRRRRR